MVITIVDKNDMEYLTGKRFKTMMSRVGHIRKVPRFGSPAMGVPRTNLMASTMVALIGSGGVVVFGTGHIP